MLLTKAQVNHRIQTQRLIDKSESQQALEQQAQLVKVGKSTKEQAREILGKIPDDVLLAAYELTQHVDADILGAKPEHVVGMLYLEFELTERGLPTRSHLKLGWTV